MWGSILGSPYFGKLTPVHFRALKEGERGLGLGSLSSGA